MKKKKEKKTPTESSKQFMCGDKRGACIAASQMVWWEIRSFSELVSMFMRVCVLCYFVSFGFVSFTFFSFHFALAHPARAQQPATAQGEKRKKTHTHTEMKHFKCSVVFSVRCVVAGCWFLFLLLRCILVILYLVSWGSFVTLRFVWFVVDFFFCFRVTMYVFFCVRSFYSFSMDHMNRLASYVSFTLSSRYTNTHSHSSYVDLFGCIQNIILIFLIPSLHLACFSCQHILVCMYRMFRFHSSTLAPCATASMCVCVCKCVCNAM